MNRALLIAGPAAVLAMAYLWGASQIPRLAIGDPLGPRVFPIMLGSGLLIGAVMLLFEARAVRPSRARAEDGASPASTSFLPIAAVIGWAWVYVTSFETLGYMIATTLFLGVLMGVLNRGRLLVTLATASLFTLVTYVLFTRLLEARLPRGLIDF